MTARPAPPVPTAEQLARRLVTAVAPDELPAFDAVATPYLAEPAAAERRLRRAQDDPLGFGLGDVVAMATPVIALVSASVVTALSDGLADSMRAGGRSVLRRVRARFGGGTVAPQALPAGGGWSAEQLAEVRRIALARATRLGMATENAEALADAVVGELLRQRDEGR
ncbi:MAG TPA: hypothetical protein VGD67_25825 [Pseudonocardiaceae bacterium]